MVPLCRKHFCNVVRHLQLQPQPVGRNFDSRSCPKGFHCSRLRHVNTGPGFRNTGICLQVSFPGHQISTSVSGSPTRNRQTLTTRGWDGTINFEWCLQTATDKPCLRVPLPKKQGADRNENSRCHCICTGQLIQRKKVSYEWQTFSLIPKVRV